VAGQTASNNNGGDISIEDFEAQSKMVYEQLIKVLAQSNASPEDVVKLNLFIVGSDDEIEESFHHASRLWEEMCPNAHLCMTALRVHELAKPDLLIQADCIALK
jgi:enamine deaminase RidA (YjgF/YER057c/UK114 family)